FCVLPVALLMQSSLTDRDASLVAPPFPTRRSSDLGRDGGREGGEEHHPEAHAVDRHVVPNAQAGDPLRDVLEVPAPRHRRAQEEDRKSTRLNSSHGKISYAVFCLKKKTIN